MATSKNASTSAFVLPLAFCLVGISQLLLCSGHAPNLIKARDRDRLQFALNLEFLEAEFFLYAALGKGLDYISPNLTLGGPPPIGAQKANLDPLVRRMTEEFGLQEVGHVRNELGMCGIKDEGIIVPEELGAENRTSSNIISADPNSLAYARTPPEILRIVYSSGNESLPGGFYPEGANGKIARSFLKIK
ncbi:hypothetical protein ACLB2K_015643 [Fragaria x ananassa]